MNAGFVQGGLTSAKDAPGLLSVGRVAYEPLWVFHTASLTLERLSDLKGKRILVGPAGGGTAGLALRLLAANGVTAETATLIHSELPDYVEKLGKGEADAGFLVLAAEARTIQRLLRQPGVRLMSFANAEAYTQRFPFLTKLSLREGVVDFAANLPPGDTVLLATTAAVLVREDAHRALVSLLAQALQEVHGAADRRDRGDAQLFQRAGEFPLASDPEFSLVRRGAPRLPLGAAAVAALRAVLGGDHGGPADRVAGGAAADPDPARALRAADLQLAHAPAHPLLVRRAEAAGGGGAQGHLAQARAEHLAELDRIEAAVDDIPVPLAFSDKLYELRQHIEVVRRRLDSGVRPAASEAA